MVNDPGFIIFGETLVDLFFNEIQEDVPGHKWLEFGGLMGGAPANVGANLASLHKPVSLISPFSADSLGSTLMELVRERQINLDLCPIISDGKMPMAMVSRDSRGERSFQLYLSGTVLEHFELQQIPLPDNVSFFHFGSVALTFEAGVVATQTLLNQLEASSAIRSYDINVRPDILKSYPLAKTQLVKMLHQVDVLKISLEDLAWIRDNVDPSLSRPEDYFRYNIKLVAYTKGSQGAELITPLRECRIPAPTVRIVDTTGGGDAFMAGILASLQENNFIHRHDLEDLPDALLKKMGAKASSCAARILSQPGAMPPVGFDFKLS